MVRNKIVTFLAVYLAYIILLAGDIYSQDIADERVAARLLEDIPLEATADIAINSKYIWRGFNMDDDPVMQSGVSVGAYGLTARVWGSFDIDNSDGTDGDEFDIILDYTYEYDRFSIAIGHTCYNFPGADSESLEFYISGGVEMFLSPTLTWYHDYGDEDEGGGEGDYFLFEISHSFPILEVGESSLTLDLNSHIAYNHKLFIEGDGGDFVIGVGLAIPLDRYTTFSSGINYSIPFGDLEDSEDGNQEDEIYFGGTLVFAL